MESTDSGSSSAQDETTAAPTTPAVTAESTPPRSRRQVWMIALSAGVVAGLLAWLIAELNHGLFRPKLYQISAMGLTALQPSQESQRVADNMNATLAFAILGGVTGLFMGLAGGLAGRAPRAVWWPAWAGPSSEPLSPSRLRWLFSLFSTKASCPTPMTCSRRS